MQLFIQTAAGSIVIILSSIALGLLTLFVLQRQWPPETRREHNAMVSASVGVIGTTYAVLIAFMLAGVWSEFQAAEINAEQEANCLVNIRRLSAGLPDPLRKHVQQLAHDYATLMISEEWPDMAIEQGSQRAHLVMVDLWNLISTMQPQDPTQQLVMEQSLSQLNLMTEHRRIRMLQSRQQLPPILWAVLIAGGVVTVMSACLFGVSNFRLHAVQVLAIAFLISLMLMAIADIQRPFQGDVHVSPDGFRYALQTFDNERTDLR
jgi:hypothetical protein